MLIMKQKIEQKLKLRFDKFLIKYASCQKEELRKLRLIAQVLKKL